ncbi:putative UPF0496 protein 2 [Miscanthus floridulus]|uniref:putative UPF0496 protein 2 n=1 Tax=Miscanthus floridulus TaxID=154761 RepID=UPI00345AA416
MEMLVISARESFNNQHRGRDLISPILHNMVMTHRNRRTSAQIELAMADYFGASAEASEMCRQLLRNIKSTQSNYRSMDSFLSSMADGKAAGTSVGGDPVVVRSNPFGTTTRGNFSLIHDRYSGVLQSIRTSHRRVARKLMVLKAVRQLSKTCLVMVCSVAAAAHLLFFCLLIGPAAAGGLYPMALRRRVAAARKRSSSRTTSVLRLREQLDTAAKGTYVLGRGLDMVSHLMAWLSDDIKRENYMVWRCVERVGGELWPAAAVQEMVGELRRSCSASWRLAEELEEHVCMCLATIHRARVLVIQEINQLANEHE